MRQKYNFFLLLVVVLVLLGEDNGKRDDKKDEGCAIQRTEDGDANECSVFEELLCRYWLCRGRRFLNVRVKGSIRLEPPLRKAFLRAITVR